MIVHIGVGDNVNAIALNLFIASLALCCDDVSIENETRTIRMTSLWNVQER